MADNEVRTVLRVDGATQGAVKALQELVRGAVEAGQVVSKASMSVNKLDEAQTTRLRERIAQLRATMTGIQEGLSKIQAKEEGWQTVIATIQHNINILREQAQQLGVAEEQTKTHIANVREEMERLRQQTSNSMLTDKERLALETRIIALGREELQAEQKLEQTRQQKLNIQNRIEAGNGKLVDSEAALLRAELQVSKQMQEQVQQEERAIGLETRLAQAESATARVSTQQAGATKQATSAFLEQHTTINRLIGDYIRAAQVGATAGRSFATVGKEAMLLGRELGTGLHNYLQQGRTAWTTYATSVQRMGIVFRSPIPAIVGLIGSLASAARSSFNWSAVAAHAARAGIALAQGFASVAHAAGLVVTGTVHLVSVLGSVAVGFARAVGAVGRFASGLTHVIGLNKVAGMAFAATSTHMAGLAVKLQGIQMGLFMAGGALTGFANSVKGVFADLLTSAGDFQQKIISIAAILGPKAAEAKEALRGVAIELGNITMFSPQDAAQVMEELIRGGISLKNVLGQTITTIGAHGERVTRIIESTTKTVMDMAAASGESLEKMTKALVSVSNIWPDMASKTTEAGDILVRVANASASSVGELTEGMKNAGPVANILGVNVKNTALALGTLANAGLRGAQGGTALRYFLLNLIPASQQAIDLFKRNNLLIFENKRAIDALAGSGQKFSNTQASILDALYRQYTGGTKSFTQAIKDGDTAVNKFQQYLVRSSIVRSKFVNEKTGELKDFGTIMQMLNDVTAKMPQDAVVKLMSALFGERGGSKGADPLITAFRRNLEEYNRLKAAGQLSVTDDANLVEKLKKEMEQLGSAQDIAKQRTQGWAGSVEYLHSSWDSLKILIGEPLLQPLAAIVRKIGDFVNLLSDFAKNNPELLKTAGIMLMLVGALAGVAGPLAIAAAAWPYLIAGITGVATAAAPLLLILGALAAGGLAVALALGKSGSGLSSVLTGVGAAIEKLTKQAVQFGYEVLINTIYPMAIKLTDLVENKLLPVLRSSGDQLKTGFGDPLLFVSNLIQNRVMPVIGNLINFLAEWLPRALYIAGRVYNEVLKPVFQQMSFLLWERVVPALAEFARWLYFQIPRAIDIVASIWRTVLWPVIKYAAYLFTEVLIPAIKQVVAFLLERLPKAVATLASIWKQNLQPVLNKAVEVFNLLVPFVLKLAGAFVDHALPAIKKVADVLTPLVMFVLADLKLKLVLAAEAWRRFSYAWEHDTLGFRTVLGTLLDVLLTPLKLLWKAVEAISEGLATLAKALGMVSDTVDTTSKDAAANWDKNLDEGFALANAHVDEHLKELTDKVTNAAGDVDQAALRASLPILTRLDEAFGGALNLQADWQTKTVGSLVDMQMDTAAAGAAIGDSIKQQLTDKLNATYGVQLDWHNQTLNDIIAMAAPAGVSANDFAETVRKTIENSLGTSLQNTQNWGSLTLQELQDMAMPAGDAARTVGNGIKDKLAAKFGLAFKDTVNWRNLTLGALVSMEQPAGESGYTIGNNYSGGILAGLDGNLQAIVQRVQFLRGQLGVAIAIYNSIPGAKGFARWDAEDARRDVAQAEAEASGRYGIPEDLLNLLSGGDALPTSHTARTWKPSSSTSGAYDGQGYTPTDDGGDGGDGGGGGDNNNDFNQNTTNPGKPDKPAKDKKSGATARTPAEQAADVANKVAQAVKDGIDALRRISGLKVPANLAAKAKEFADAVAVLVMALQSVALRFKDEALNKTQLFAETGAKIMDLLAKGLEVFKALPGFVAPVKADVQALLRAIDFVVAMLTAIASHYAMDGLVQAGIYADTATKVVELVGKASDDLSKVNDATLPSEAAMAALVASTDRVLQLLVPLAEQWSPEALDAAAAWSDATSKVMDAIGKGADTLTKVQNIEVSLNDVVAHVKVILDASYVIVGQLVALVGKSAWDAKTLDRLASYTGAVGSGMDMLAKAADTLGKLNDPKLNLANALPKAQELAKNALAIMAELTRLVEEQGLSAWTIKNATKVGEYATQVGVVADALGKASDLFQKVLQPKYILDRPAARIHELVVAAVDMMASLAALWQHEPAWTIANAEKVGQYATATGLVADGLTKVVDFLAKLNLDKTDYKHLADRVRELANAAQQMMNVLGPLTAGWQGWTEDTATWATTTGTVAENMTKVMDFLGALDKQQVEFRNLAGRVIELANAAQQMMNVLGPLTAGWENYAEQTVIWANAGGTVAENLTKVMEFLTGLSQSKVAYRNLADRVGELVRALADVMAQIRTALPADYQDNGLTQFVAAAGAVADALSKVQSLLDSAAGGKQLSTAGLTRLAQLTVQMVQSYVLALQNVGQTLDEAGQQVMAGAAAIATSQGTIIATISAVFDLWQKLSVDETKAKVDPNTKVQPLVQLLLSVVQAFAAARAQFAAAVDEETAKLADESGNALAALTNAFDFFAKLKEFTGISHTSVTQFLDDLRFTVSLLQQYLPTIGEETLTAAKQFGEKMGPAFDVLASALAFFATLTGSDEESTNDAGETTSKHVGGWKPVDPASISAFIASLQLLITLLRDGLLNQIAPEFMDLANAFGVKMGPALDVIKTALDIFLAIQGGDNGGLRPIDPDAIGALLGALYLVLHHWHNIIIGGEFQGDFAERSAAFAAVVEQVLRSVQHVLDLAKSLQAEGSGEGLAALPAALKAIYDTLQVASTTTLPAALQALDAGFGQFGTITATQAVAVVTAIRQMFADVRDLIMAESSFENEDSLLNWWAGKDLKKSLWGRMIDRVNGKAGARWFIIEAVAGLFRGMNEFFNQDGLTFFHDWATAWDGAAAAVESAVQRINAAIGAINTAGAGGSFNFGYTPPESQNHLATGGVVMHPMTSQLAEDEPELVLPLSKARELGFGGGQGQTTNNNVTNNIRQLTYEQRTDVNVQRRRERDITDPFS